MLEWKSRLIKLLRCSIYLKQVCKKLSIQFNIHLSVRSSITQLSLQHLAQHLAQHSAQYSAQHSAQHHVFSQLRNHLSTNEERVNIQLNLITLLIDRFCNRHKYRTVHPLWALKGILSPLYSDNAIALRVFLAWALDDRDWLIANVCALRSAHMHIGSWRKWSNWLQLTWLFH